MSIQAPARIIIMIEFGCPDDWFNLYWQSVVTSLFQHDGWGAFTHTCSDWVLTNIAYWMTRPKLPQHVSFMTCCRQHTWLPLFDDTRVGRCLSYWREGRLINAIFKDVWVSDYYMDLVISHSSILIFAKQ